MTNKTGQNPRELPQNGYAIYQLKPDSQYHSLRFASLSELRSLGRRDGNHDDAALGVTESRYDLVYSGVLSPALAAYRTPEAILEGLYTRFNLNRPDDFHGHSLSVSDVIALNLNGQTECYYTDSFIPSSALRASSALHSCWRWMSETPSCYPQSVENPHRQQIIHSSIHRVILRVFHRIRLHL